MRKYLAIVIILYTFVAQANVELGLDLGTDEVNQGELVKAHVFLRPEQVKKFSVQGLQGKQIAKTIYIQKISAFMGKEGQGFYTADATVVFMTVPETLSVSETIDGETVTLVWKDLKVNPTEAKDFLFSEFDVPTRLRYALWIVLALVVAGLAYAAKILVEKQQEKKRLKDAEKKLKEQIVSCSNYDMVVELWKRKRLMVEKFPVLDEPFDTLEATLFKHQFKRERTATDLEDVMEAYMAFKQRVEEVFRGV